MSNVENLLKAEKLEVDRIQGDTRELTALEIAKRLDEIKPIDDFLIDIQGYTYGTGIMINGKEHTLIENLKYEIINDNQVGNVVNL